MTQVRSAVRGQVRSPVRGQMTLATGSRDSFHDGIAFNAQTGRVVVKAPGASPTIGTLTSLFTFTGGNQSLFVGPNGLLQQSVTNTPRIEYNPVGGAVLGLLMETSRTNLCLQSADFGTSWIVSGATISVNQTASPDGAVNADKLVESVGGTFHLVRQDITIAANTSHTFSVFLAPAGRNFARVQLSDNTEANGAFIDVNLLTGATGTLTTFGLGASAAVTVTPYANGFYRVAVRCTVDTTSVTARVQILSASALGTVNYSGDGTSGLHCYGGQLEAAQFASSYIPTTTVSVARTADSCIRTLGSEFSATAGTVVVAGRASGGQDAANRQPVFSFDDGTAANRIPLLRNAATDNCQLRIDAASVNQTAILGTFTNSTVFKCSTAWASNDAALSFNGGAVQTDATVTLPTVTGLGIGYEPNSTTQMNGHIRTFDYWPGRFPNNLLQQLST